MRLLIDADVDGDLLGQHMATALLAGASEAGFLLRNLF